MLWEVGRWGSTQRPCQPVDEVDSECAWKTKGAQKGARQPQKPFEPVAERYIVSDTTVEAPAPILEARPRGVLLSRDELGGWIASFDQYKTRAGSDTANWLSMHRAGPITIDRKTGRRIIHVPRVAVSITGGIQPDVLRRALAGQHTENGLAARILFALPPKRRRRWTDATINGTVDAAVEYVFDRLLNLGYANESPVTGEASEAEPLDLDLDADAKAAWIAFVNTHGDEQYDLAGPLSAAWSKLEGYAARLALIVQLIRWAAGDSAASYTGRISRSIQSAAAGPDPLWYRRTANKSGGPPRRTISTASRRHRYWLRRWANAQLLRVPSGLVRILDRDLRAADIPKRDERGRTVDVHALRHSFGTLLSKGGVAPRTAQAAMRHSTIDLTMNVYTDPKLLDVHGALDALPALPLDREQGRASVVMKATGTDDSPLAPTSGVSSQIRSIAGKSEGPAANRTDPRRVAATSFAVKGKDPLTTLVNGPCEVERKGVEPSTSALRTQRSPN